MLLELSSEFLLRQAAVFHHLLGGELGFSAAFSHFTLLFPLVDDVAGLSRKKYLFHDPRCELMGSRRPVAARDRLISKAKEAQLMALKLAPVGMVALAAAAILSLPGHASADEKAKLMVKYETKSACTVHLNYPKEGVVGDRTFTVPIYTGVVGGLLGAAIGGYRR